MTHCVICIYKHLDLTEYFRDMIQISQLMKFHFENSRRYQNSMLNIKLNGNQKIDWKSHLQNQAQPKYLKQLLTEIIGDIMSNICEQVLYKMRRVGVIVKEPMARRASHDDYNLCFENSARRCNGTNLNGVFGAGFYNQSGIFVSNQQKVSNNQDEQAY
jgi:hypothetical protein